MARTLRWMVTGLLVAPMLVVPTSGWADLPSHTYLIPAAAHLNGLGGTTWRSDVVLHNPGPDPAEVALSFLPPWQDNSGVVGHPVVVAARASLALADIVAEEFGEMSGAGALLVRSDEPLLVTSRTFNDAPSGTYGQLITGRETVAAVAGGEEVRLTQLTRNADFRTNIGFANATDQVIVIDVELYRANGTTIGAESFTIQPYGYHQETDIIPVTIDDAYAVVSSGTAGATYFSYASVVDEISGDPILILPVATSHGIPVYVPAAAHLGGTADTNWRTDLEVHNPGLTDASFTVELLRRDQSNPAPQTMMLSLGAGHSIRYEDVLQDLFGFTGAGALRITPTEGAVTVTSRTYNDVPGGTYGQFIPGYPATRALTTGVEARLIQLFRSPSESTGFRTNVGFTEAAGVSTDIEVALYTASGQALGTVPVSLRPYEHRQVNDIFGEITEGAVDDGYAVITTDTRNAAYFAYASVVDNRSGDPIYLPATPTPDWIVTSGVWMPTELQNVSVYALATDPYDTGRVLVGTKGDGLRVSNDWGAHWSRLSSGLEEDEVLALAFSATVPDTVFAGTWHQETGNWQGGIYRSTDGGENWSKKQGAHVRAIAVHPGDGDVVLVGTQGAGIYRTDDGGENWAQFNEGLSSLYVKSLAFAESMPSVVFAASEWGVNRSEDVGVSWSYAGLEYFFECVAVHPLDSSVVLATSHPMNGGDLYVSEDGGKSWTRDDSAPLGVTRVMFDPVEPDRVFLGTAENGVFVRVAGGPWVAMNDGLTDLRINALALSGGSPRFLYAGTAGEWTAIGDGAVFVMQLPGEDPGP